jgi:hypothetical protein
MTSVHRALAVLLAATFVACHLDDPPPEQPIAFNHRLHVVRNRIPCTDCHVGALRQERATLPPITRCLLCHMKPQGKQPNPRERVVRRLGAQGTPVTWTQVTRNPRHVHFSHRAHTTLAKISCPACHGDVTQWTQPPTEANAKLRKMNTCRNCHRKRGATLDCISCHHY